MNAPLRNWPETPRHPTPTEIALEIHRALHEDFLRHMGAPDAIPARAHSLVEAAIKLACDKVEAGL